MLKSTRTPDWISASYSEWPSGIQIAYLLMAQAAQRRLAAEASEDKRDDRAEGRAA